MKSCRNNNRAGAWAFLAVVLAAAAAIIFVLTRDAEVGRHDAAVFTEQPPVVGTPAPSQELSPAPSLTADPTAGPSYAPAPTPTPGPIPASVEEAIALYEAYPVDYPLVDRTAAPRLASVPQPRYTQGDDGVWRSDDCDGDGRAVLILTGDLMCQTRQEEGAQTANGYDFSASFSYVKDIFSEGELVVGNLEGITSPTAPLMREMNEVEGCPFVNMPSEFVGAMRGAGYDMVVMSNNHNCDAGVRGVYDTIDSVELYGLIHTGLFRTLLEPRVTVVEVDGIKIGFMSYSVFFNYKEDHFTESGFDVLFNRLYEERVERDIAAVRAAGAEYVMIYMHWGKEYVNYTTQKQLDRAQWIADLGADYIIGSHPHAVQAYDIVTASDGRKVPVFYSLGNFISHQVKEISKETAILRVVLERDGDGKVVLAEEGYIPARTFKDYDGIPYSVIPLTAPYSKGAKSRYIASAYEHITSVVGDKIPVIGKFEG